MQGDTGEARKYKVGLAHALHRTKAYGIHSGRLGGLHTGRGVLKDQTFVDAHAHHASRISAVSVRTPSRSKMHP
jgi:hypothetical protein